MGQGLYTMLGFGMVGNSELIFNEEGERIQDEILERTFANQLKTSYETRPDYLVLPLAVDDGFLQDWWKVPELPYNAIKAMVGPRKCREVEIDETALPTIVSERLAKVRAEWKSIQAAYLTHTINLPDGKFVLISDWD